MNDFLFSTRFWLLLFGSEFWKVVVLDVPQGILVVMAILNIDLVPVL
ncbi:MAG: DUF3937 family protein [Oscillospiraceae bacterium]|nr:DUF3937 family protein [Oscillospiraceae bacterium]